MQKARNRLILHCGLPKTGTTALQLWLYRARDLLREAGVQYPGPFLDHEPKQGYLIPALRHPDGIKQIADRLSEPLTGNVLLSNEGLSNHLYDFDPGTLRAFRDLTRDMDTTVVYLTRSHEAWLRSYHRQCVLNPNSGASDLWGTSLTLDQIRRHPRILALTDHQRLSEDMAEAFGARDCQVLDFDNPAWFETFLTSLGLAHLADRPLPHTNQSVPDWMIETLRQANALNRDKRDWCAWRQAAQRFLATESVQLVQAAAAPAETVDLDALAAIAASPTWTEADTSDFHRFLAGIRESARPPSSGQEPDTARHVDVPRTVWMLWLQGWDRAPDVAHAARTSWQRRNPGWQIRLVDRASLTQFLPAEIVDRIFAVPKEPENLADQIRLELLHRHGGVWTDATTLCAIPLDDWLPQVTINGFFAFSSPGQDRMLANWFLAARPSSYILSKWREATWAYWAGRTECHTYFWMHGLFKKLYDDDPTFRALWDATPVISARHPFHFGPDAAALFAPPPVDIQALLRAPPAPVFKLTHKFSKPLGADSLFSCLCRYATDVEPEGDLPFQSR